MKSIIFFFLLQAAGLFALTTPGTLLLWNDSSYILTANVYTQYGEFLGQTTLQPGQQSHFTTNLYSTPINRPGAPDFAITPYRIVWKCPGGSTYSTCTNGSTGSLVRASLCSGSLECTQKNPNQENSGSKKTPKTEP